MAYTKERKDAALIELLPPDACSVSEVEKEGASVLPRCLSGGMMPVQRAS